MVLYVIVSDHIIRYDIQLVHVHTLVMLVRSIISSFAKRTALNYIHCHIHVISCTISQFVYLIHARMERLVMGLQAPACVLLDTQETYVMNVSYQIV